VEKKRLNILITGAAGFIGYHLVNRLVREDYNITGLDNLNNYYDVKLKLDRLADAGIDNRQVAYNEPVVSERYPNYTFVQLGIEDAANLERLFARQHFDLVCHLAAQAGVRYSIKHPEAYIQSNIVGFFNILESCRHHQIKHLVYASSSSVYGNSQKVPFQTDDSTDAPISFYAATKKSNELMAHTYSHLFSLPCTGLRFFTVYGPWGRPDMAYSLFAKAITEGRPIQVFNEGNLSRDFTYVDDIVEGMARILGHGPKSGYQVYNIGNSRPTPLNDFIEAIEAELGIPALRQHLPMQPGDVETTYADVSALMKDYDYQPATAVKDGIRQFVHWYRAYHAQGN
jgi:UDP-glucuronate 4-epimerase